MAVTKQITMSVPVTTIEQNDRLPAYEYIKELRLTFEDNQVQFSGYGLTSFTMDLEDLQELARDILRGN